MRLFKAKNHQTSEWGPDIQTTRAQSLFLKPVLWFRAFYARHLAVTRTHPHLSTLGLIVFLFLFGLVTNHIQQLNSYKLSAKDKTLLSRSSIDTKKVKETQDKITYNQASSTESRSTVTVSSAVDSTGKAPYTATLAKTDDHSISFGDSEDKLSFKLIPLNDLSDGQLQGGQVLYPGQDSARQIYTFKRNGVKGDILLSRAPANTVTYSWKLDLPDSLEAKTLPNGSIGIYSANPMFSDPKLQVGDSKTQALIDNAKKNGAKDYLAFVLPAPYITELKDQDKPSSETTNSNLTTQNSTDVSYQLKDNILTLTAKNLEDKTYPLSIDPTITVTTTADFRTGSDDGMINYGTTDQIGRSNVTTGTVSTWDYTHASTNDDTTFVSGFAEPRVGLDSVAYNGYLYVLGGDSDSANQDCNFTSGYCKGVQFAAINSDGTIGTWAYTHASTNDGGTFSDGFIQTRRDFTAVAYNGYMYVIGGSSGSSSNDCTATSNWCSGVQFAPINSNGTIGTWAYTHASTNDSTSFVSGFTNARVNFSSIAYNGYLYVIGGWGATSTDDCTDNFTCTGVQFAPINSDGTIGTWAYTHNSTNDSTSYVSGFIRSRLGLSAVAYNGYLYVSGGQSGSSGDDCTDSFYCIGTEFAPINSNGTIGTWNYTGGGSSCSSWASPCTSNTFIRAREGHTSVAYNGYFYVSGGDTSFSSNDCTSLMCFGTQFAPINSNGTLGAWAYTGGGSSCSSWGVPCSTAGNFFNKGRFGHSTAVYNGYLYILGGRASGATGDCTGVSAYCKGVQFTALSTTAATGFGKSTTWAYTHSSINDGTTFSTGFSQARGYHTIVAYNGYLYVIGGNSGSSANDCTATNQRCNGTQFAPINSDGTIGTWNYTGGSSSCATFASPCSTTGNSFRSNRYAHNSLAYNGYLYVIGGISSSGTEDCSSVTCNGVQFAAINSDGTIGSWAFTHSSTNDGGSFVSGFNNPRNFASSVAYNGYLYVIGGQGTNAADDCNNGALKYCNGVQFAAINSDGTIGSWAFTHSSTNDGGSFVSGFTEARYGHTTVAYNGYLYLIGGVSLNSANDCANAGLVCSGTQFAPINSNGTIGTWNYTGGGNSCATWVAPCSSGANTYIQPRTNHISAAYNGYLYISGGSAGGSGSDCTASGNYCVGTQFTSINSNGTVGTWSYTGGGSTCATWVAPCSTSGNFTKQARDGHGSAVYNGYLYVTGGISGSSANDCIATSNYCSGVQFTALSSPAQQGRYERVFDAGAQTKLYTISYNGTAKCGAKISYKVAPTSGVFGASTTLLEDAKPGTTYTVNAASTRYALVVVTLNDQSCGGTSLVTDISVNFNSSPGAPTLTSPTNGSHPVPDTPTLNFTDTDADSEDIRYNVQIDTVNTFNSQSGAPLFDKVSGTDAGFSGTADSSDPFSSSNTDNSYTLQSALTRGVTYYWRVSAKDPSGTNSYGSWSATNSFTVNSITAPTLIQAGSGATQITINPVFKLGSTDVDSDFHQYAIKIYTAQANCNADTDAVPVATNLVRSIDQTSSQTGWSMQDASSNTAYLSAPSSYTVAVYTYQNAPLEPNVDYWWKGKAKDPTPGTNLWSSWTACQVFTTGPKEVRIQGGVNIRGGTTIQ